MRVSINYMDSESGWQSMEFLGALVLNAAVTGDVQLDPVADDVTRDVVAQGTDKALNSGGAELTDVSAPDADGVVMVLNAGQAVPGSAVHEVKPADDAGLHQELDGPEDGRPARSGQLNTNLFGGKALPLPLQNLNNGPSRSRGTVSLILEGWP